VLYNEEVEAIMAGKEVVRPPASDTPEAEAAAASHELKQEQKRESDHVEMLPPPEPMQKQKPEEKPSA
jgi:hypothetical protein